MSRPRTRSELDLVVLGYSAPNATPAAKLRMTEFSILLSQLAMIDVSITALGSYERVAQLIFKGEIDLAWLSPIPFISLARRESVVALATMLRRGGTTYEGAFIVPVGSRAKRLADLKGKRAGWVDRHSASGFVLPRLELWEGGIDPRKAFSSERFYGSHEALIRAVAEGQVDFGATRVDSWLRTPYESRVKLMATFGEIPSDVIAARIDLEPKAREIVTKAFLRLSAVDHGLALIRDVFGAEDFRKPDLASYERLREEAAGANEEGILSMEEEREPIDDGSADRTIEISMRPKLESLADADLIEVHEVTEPRRRQPSRPVIAARPTAVAPRGAKPRPAAVRPAQRPLPPRKT